MIYNTFYIKIIILNTILNKFFFKINIDIKNLRQLSSFSYKLLIFFVIATDANNKHDSQRSK